MQEQVRWRSVVILPEEKLNFVQTYNRINNAIIQGYNDKMIFENLYPELKEIKYLNNPTKRYNFYYAMKASLEEKNGLGTNKRLKYIIFKLDTYNVSLMTKMKNFFTYLINFIKNGA